MFTIEDLDMKIKSIAENYKEEPTGGWITGDGPVPCEIMFIGEAPGKTEVEEGKPFVGIAGKNLEYYLNLVGLTRNEIRISNTCFLRPIKINTSKTGRTTISNRAPKTKEVEMFRDVLDQEILLVNPKIIITLGNIPLKRFTKFNSIGQCHGVLIEDNDNKRNVFPMYHPSALTYNRNDEFKSMYTSDWLKLKDVLQSL